MRVSAPFYYGGPLSDIANSALPTNTVPAVSIVVPVYNVEKYLPDCVKSIQAQTFTDYEVIFVNDGSTDESASILLEAVALWPGERARIITQDNQGLSVARNVGMAAARGTYLYFLDSDDMIVPHMLETTVSRMEEDCLDVLFFGIKTICESPDLLREYDTLHRHSLPIASGMKIMNELEALREYRVQVWSYLSRRDHLLKGGMSFIPGIVFEDAPFTFEALATAQRVAVISDELYLYRRREGSITNEQLLLRSFKGRIAAFCRIHELMRTNPAFRTKGSKHALMRTRILCNQTFHDLGFPLSEYDGIALSTGLCSETLVRYARRFYLKDVARQKVFVSKPGRVVRNAKALYRRARWGNAKSIQDING